MSAMDDTVEGNGQSAGSVIPEKDTAEVKREESPPAKKIKTEDNSTKNNAPVHEVVGGSSVRQYLNKHLTQHLLEGLKQIGKDKPEDPLRTLGEFLIQRSDELKKQ